MYCNLKGNVHALYTDEQVKAGHGSWTGYL